MDLNCFPSIHSHVETAISEFIDTYRKIAAWSQVSLKRDNPHSAVIIMPEGKMITAWHVASDPEYSYEYYLGDDRTIYRSDGCDWVVVSTDYYTYIAREYARELGASSNIESCLARPYAMLQRCADFAIQKQGTRGAKELELVGASAA